MGNLEEIQRELLQSWGIIENNTVTKEALIEAIAYKVGKLLEANPDQLFSKLYRLDISEGNIKKAMIDEAGFSFIIHYLVSVTVHCASSTVLGSMAILSGRSSTGIEKCPCRESMWTVFITGNILPF